MKDLDDMNQSIEIENVPSSMKSKFVSFLLLLLASTGLGYCFGKFMAADALAISDGIIILVATAVIIGLIQRSVKQLPAETRGTEARKKFVQMGLGALFGIAGMIAALWLLDDQIKLLIDQQKYWHMAALFLAFLHIIFAIIIAANAKFKKLLPAKPGDDPLSDEEFDDMRMMLLWSAIGLLFYGLILVVLAVCEAKEGAPNWYALAALVAVMAGQSASGFVLWRRYDELYREITMTGAAISYIVLETILILWAGLSIFGFVLRFDPISIVVILLTIGFVTTITIAIKRGVHA
jgi:hypothetical protein